MEESCKSTEGWRFIKYLHDGSQSSLPEANISLNQILMILTNTSKANKINKKGLLKLCVYLFQFIYFSHDSKCESYNITTMSYQGLFKTSSSNCSLTVGRVKSKLH